MIPSWNFGWHINITYYSKMTTSRSAVFDVKYDGDVVKFYDERLNEFDQVSLTVHCSRSDLLEAIQGSNKISLRNGMCLVSDATNIQGTDEGTSHMWYAKLSGLLKAKLSMNTSWNPAFVYIKRDGEDRGKFRKSDFAPNTNIVIVPDNDTCIQMKKKENLELWNPERTNYLIMPLLETIRNVYPIHTGLTLRRLVAKLEGEYNEEWMEKPHRVMSVLFHKFIGKFNELSQREACSLGELHKCLFPNTFRVSLSARPSSSSYIGTTFFSTDLKESVIMTTKSSLFAAEDYGDVPWFLVSDKERETISGNKNVRHWNKEFVILSDQNNMALRSDSVEYRLLVVFPRMDIDGQIREYGSTIGWPANGQVDFRGPLFDDISPREEMIIEFLFEKFALGTLEPNMNPIEQYRLRPLPGKCRVELIDKIKRELLKYNRK
jgi:hypothetical protein